MLWVYIVFFAVLLGVFYLFIFREHNFTDSKLAVINPLIPEFQFTNQDQKTITTETTADKVYVAEFFFTTCKVIQYHVTVASKIQLIWSGACSPLALSLVLGMAGRSAGRAVLIVPPEPPVHTAGTYSHVHIQPLAGMYVQQGQLFGAATDEFTDSSDRRL